jgi:hypothetical protein
MRFAKSLLRVGLAYFRRADSSVTEAPFNHMVGHAHETRGRIFLPDMVCFAESIRAVREMCPLVRGG